MTEKFLVRIPNQYRGMDSKIIDWLNENYKHGTYEQLYRHWWPNDGRWRSGPDSEISYVEFDKESDAMAFKLKWS